MSGCDEVDGAGEDASGPHAFADPGEEIALQVEEFTDQIVGGGLDGELVHFEVCHAGVEGGVWPHLAEMADGDLRGIDGGDLPAEFGKIERVAAGAAGEIEGAAGGQHIGDFDEERRGFQIERTRRASRNARPRCS